MQCCGALLRRRAWLPLDARALVVHRPAFPDGPKVLLDWRFRLGGKPRFQRSPTAPSTAPMAKAPEYQTWVSKLVRPRSSVCAQHSMRDGLPLPSPLSRAWRARLSAGQSGPLSLIKRLRADLAHVVDAHQRRRVCTRSAHPRSLRRFLRRGEGRAASPTPLPCAARGRAVRNDTVEACHRTSLTRSKCASRPSAIDPDIRALVHHDRDPPDPPSCSRRLKDHQRVHRWSSG